MLQLPIEVIVHYPRQARAGVSYIMSIDLRFNPQSASWPFDKEEIPIHCLVSSPLFSIKLPPEPVFYLHRFGGTYGGLYFKLKAADVMREGQITLLLINNGLPVGNVGLETKIVAREADAREVRDIEEITPAPNQTPEGLTLATKIGSEFPINDLAWSPDGRLLASATNNFVDIHDAETSRAYRSFTAHQGMVWCLAWSPDGERLASGSEDQTVRIWSLSSSAAEMITKTPGSEVRSLAWSPDGDFLASGSEMGAVGFWNLREKNMTRIMLEELQEGANECLAWSPDGHLLASGSEDRTVQLWEPLKALRGYTTRSSGGGLLRRQLVRTLSGHMGKVRSLAWSPDGRILATGSSDRIVRLWEPYSGKQIRVLEGHTGEVTCLRFSPDGRLLASNSSDGATKLWRTDDWQTVTTISDLPDMSESGMSNRGLAFHPSGKRLATLGAADKDIRLWELDPDLLLGLPPQEQAVRYATARILLLGDSGVGKSSLGWRLAYGAFKEQPATHGQQAWVLDQLSVRRSDGTECEAILWDLAGMPDYRLIHNLFLDDADLALLVFDPTNMQEPLRGVEFWLKQLPIPMALSCPMILVGARADRGAPRLTAKEIEEFCRRHGITGGYIATSAAENSGLDQLMLRMKELIPWEEKVTTVTTVTFKRIKDYVLGMKERDDRSKVIVNSKALREQLEKTDKHWRFTDAEMMTAVRHLENHSFVMVLRGSQGERMILLAPELFINLASSFVLEARRSPKGLGILEEERLLQHRYKFPELSSLDRQMGDVLLSAVTARFFEHAVCFRETLGGQTFLVFPALINLKRPMTEAVETVDDVSYRVRGAVENIYTALVVMLGYSNVFTRSNQWQNQAQYEVNPGEVCGFRVNFEAEGEASFVLYYGVQTSPSARTMFQALFERILASRGTRFTKQRPVTCPECEHRLEETAVALRSRQGLDYMYCPECGNRVDLPKVEEGEAPVALDASQEARNERALLRLRTKFEASMVWVKALVRDRGLNKVAPSCFLSYAWGNYEHERWMLRLTNDLQNAGIGVQNSSLTHGKRVIDWMPKSDFILVVGTTASGEKARAKGSSVYNTEMRLIREMAGKRPRRPRVLPLLLEGTPQTSFPSFLTSTVFLDFRRESDYFRQLLSLILSIYRIPPNDPAVTDLLDGLTMKE